MKDMSRVLEHKEDKGYLKLMNTLNQILKLKQSATVGCQVKSNEMILKGKLKGCKGSTKKPKLSETLVLDLTSKEKDCKPYWNDLCKEISSKLWLPIEINLQDSDLTLLSSLPGKMVGKSWFSTISYKQVKKQSLPKTYLQSFITSPAKCMGEEVIRSRKIRIYPTANQRKLYKRWFGTSRFVYNETINHINSPNKENHWMGAAKVILNNLPTWAKEVPYQIKKIAVEDAYLAYGNGFKKLKQTGQVFNLKYRSKKGNKQSCFIPKDALNNLGIYHTIAGSLKMSEKLPEDFKDLRLLLENGRWFLHVPYRAKVNSIENQDRVIALDAGIRTFLTGFSDNEVVKIGGGDFGRIERLSSHCDKLISKMSKSKSKKKYKLKKALNRIKWKIWDLVDELHFKSINFLLKSYDVIILPEFETSNMVEKIKRKLNSKTARALLGYSFFRFQQRLISKAGYYGKTIVRISEAFTSKTASWTGEVKNIGSGKIIKSDGIKLCRDINGARGIYIRALRDSSLLVNTQHAMLTNS